MDALFHDRRESGPWREGEALLPLLSAPDPWRALGQRGFFRTLLPPAHGGADEDARRSATRLEALGAAGGDLPALMAFAAHALGGAHVLAREGRHGALLDAALAGERVLALAMSEPEGSAAGGAPATTASPEDGGWRLHGIKSWVMNLPLAQAAIVLVAAPEPTLFLVDRDTPGARFADDVLMPPMEGATFGTLHLEGCRVSDAERLCARGAALPLLAEILRWERTLAVAPHVGALARLADEAVAHARRPRRGRRLGDIATVAARCAEMRMRADLCALLLHDGAARLVRARRDHGSAAALRVQVGRALRDSAMDAIHVAGALGLTGSRGPVRALGAALALTHFAGSDDVLVGQIARQEGLL